MFRSLRWSGVLCAAFALAAAVAAPRDAAAVSELRPNLQPLRAHDIRFDNVSGGSFLRFSATSWNSGVGPVVIVGKETSGGSQNVYQRIYNDDGSYAEYFAGSFDYHPEHGHVHFNNYAVYTLQPVDAPGASARNSAKTTFCILDTTRVKRLPGAPKRPVYTTCGDVVQGMSVGWGDTYGYWLAGQSIDVTGLPDGDYSLVIEVDPLDRIRELNEGDNVSTVLLRLSSGGVQILDGKPGRSH